MHLEPFQSDYEIIPQLYHYNKVANNLHCLCMKIYADTSINKHTQTQPVNQREYQVLSNPWQTCQKARGQISWMRGGNERETDNSVVLKSAHTDWAQVKKHTQKKQKVGVGSMRGSKSHR